MVESNWIATNQTRLWRAWTNCQAEIQKPGRDPHRQIQTCPQYKQLVLFLQECLSCCHNDLRPQPCHFSKRKETRSAPRDRTLAGLSLCPAPWDRVRRSRQGSPGFMRTHWVGRRFFILKNECLAQGLGWGRALSLLFSLPPSTAHSRRKHLGHWLLPSPSLHLYLPPRQGLQATSQAK